MRILIVSLVFLMTSCSLLRPEPLVIEKPIYLSKKLPDTLLYDCSIPPPPSKDVYLKSDPTNREYILSVYIQDLLIQLSDCGQHMEAIREWKDKVLDVTI